MSNDGSRLIRLRRPPVINLVSDRWVPSEVDLSEVDAVWRALCEENPRFHDGELLHVLGVVRNGHAGATIHVAPTSYRFHAVRRLGVDTGIRPLGVKGLCVVPDPVTGEASLVAGRRSAETASYPGRWEYLPGGGVDRIEPPIDPVLVIRRELEEEIGGEGSVDPIALAILEDVEVGTWEIVYRASIGAMPATPPNWEHDELRAVTPDSLPGPASAAAQRLSTVAHDVLRAARV